MRIPRRTLGAATLLLALAACNGGGGDSADRATTTVAGTGSTTPGPSTPRTTSADPFCNFVQTFQDRFGRIGVGFGDPAQLRTFLTEAATAIRDAQATAPASIRADVGLLNEAFQRLLAVFQQANFDLTRVNPNALAELQSPQNTAASERLEAYRTQNCV